MKNQHWPLSKKGRVEFEQGIGGDGEEHGLEPGAGQREAEGKVYRSPLPADQVPLPEGSVTHAQPWSRTITW